MVPLRWTFTRYTSDPRWNGTTQQQHFLSIWRFSVLVAPSIDANTTSLLGLSQIRYFHISVWMLGTESPPDHQLQNYRAYLQQISHSNPLSTYCVRQHQRNSLRDPSASVESESVIHHHNMTSIATALFSSVEIQPSNISVIQQQQHSQHISASTYQPQRPFASNHREYYPGYSQPVRASTQNTAHPLLQSISHSW